MTVAEQEESSVPESVPEEWSGESESRLGPGLVLDGDGAVSLYVGGATPDVSVAKLKGKSISVSGNYEKGQTFDLVISVRVGEVKFTDKVDSEGEVIETKRTHVLEVVDVDRRKLD